MKKKIITTTNIIKEDKRKVKEMCLKHSMKQYELLHFMIDFFYTQKTNPKEIISQRELRDTFISFIRKQEKMFHIPIKNDLGLLINQQQKVDENVNSLKKELKFLFDFLKNK